MKRDEIAIAKDHTSPRSCETLEDPPIPTKLQTDMDTPVREFRPSATARRSRPFREGRGRGAPHRSLSTVYPWEGFKFTPMQPSHELVELDTSDEDDAHNSISTDSSHDEPATVSVAEISLATFNLGH